MSSIIKNRLVEIIKFKGEYSSLLILIFLIFLILYVFFEINIYLTIGTVIVSLFYIRLLQAQQLGNSIQITEHQFPEIYNLAVDCAKTLNIKKIPKLFVSQDPTLNAFTMGFKSPYMIVLNSALIEKLNKEEIKVVIGHEMGHVKFKHTMILSVISPIGKNIVFVDLFFGFWQRKTEYTADRCVLICAQDKDVVIKTLIKIAGGAGVGQDANLDKIMLQLQGARSTKLDKLGEVLGSHPYFVKRIWEIIKFNHKYNPVPCQNCSNLNQREANFCWACGNKVL